MLIVTCCASVVFLFGLLSFFLIMQLLTPVPVLVGIDTHVERQPSLACAELGSNGSQRQMFEDPAAWCADRAPGQQLPEDALPLDVRQLQNSALPLQVRSRRLTEAMLYLCCNFSSLLSGDAAETAAYMP